MARKNNPSKNKRPQKKKSNRITERTFIGFNFYKKKKEQEIKQ